MSTLKLDRDHTHKLVYLGKLLGEFGGDYPLYQCRECGATFEAFAGGKYAIFYPEWTVDRATKGRESTEFVKGSLDYQDSSIKRIS